MPTFNLDDWAFGLTLAAHAMGPSSKTRWRLPVRLHVGWSKCFLRGYSMRELRSKIS